MLSASERKLPIGIQSFEEIRKNHYVYVDKTAFIRDLVRTGKPYFLSRPRRFGKSLLVSTMEAYFEGKRELFHQLEIERWENAKSEGAWTQYPVISFYLSGGNYQQQGGLEDRLTNTMRKCAEKYGLDRETAMEGRTLAVQFQNLIESLCAQTGRQVVILVDEYDKPLLDNIDVNEAQEEHNRQLFKGFFSILKDEDAYLKFVFFTGVTKFSKVSIFSDLNQLIDVSLDDGMDSVCGITSQELERTFGPEIQAMAGKLGIDQSECTRRLAQMYDGYHFSPEGEGVYNPFSLLCAFRDKRLRRYWYESGTPAFLLKKLKKSHFTPEQFSDGIAVDEERMTQFLAENKDPVPLLYQAGYLTIACYDEEFQIYTLKFPNNEVKYGMLGSLAPVVFGEEDVVTPVSQRAMVEDLRTGKAESFLMRLKALFAGVPYLEGKAPEYEQIWRNQLYIVFAMLGQNVRCEVHSATGRADCVIETSGYIYIMEFKMDRPAREAFDQIEQKGYALPYAMDSRKVIKAGVAFSSEEKNISDWIIR